MLILARHDVEALLTMPAVITAVETGFAQLAAGNVVMPQRISTQVATHNGVHLSMPAYVAGDPGALTIKVVTVYGDNLAHYGVPTIQGVLLLHDARTGQVLALMDAEHLTAMRTGAASGVAANYLARPNAATMTLFGAGALGPGQLAAICAVRPIQRAYVITRTGDKDAAFCARMSQDLGIEVQPTRDVRHAVSAADIICTATDAKTPLFDGSWLRPGAHINAVGTFTRTARELDTTTIVRSRVFVDHHTAARTEAGDLLIPIAEGAVKEDHVIGALGEVINGALVGRSNDQEITVFKSVGLGMQDAVTAERVYRLAVEKGVGLQVNL